jgi:hypothetical protein
MTQHRIEEICIVDNNRSFNLELSLEQPSATSIKLLN